MRISDWSSDVCSSDLAVAVRREAQFLLFCRAVVVARRVEQRQHLAIGRDRGLIWIGARQARLLLAIARHRGERTRADIRSEEHTSELQSLMRISYAVFCLKTKKTTQLQHISTYQSSQHT